MYIKRLLAETIEKRLYKGKAIIFLGARQVGNSSFLTWLADKSGDAILSLNCDEPDTRRLLDNISAVDLRLLLAKNKCND